MAPSDGPGVARLAGFGRTVVTGAAGFVGSHLVSRLAGYGGDVIAVDVREPASRIPGVSYMLADLRMPCQARDALEGAGLVFHLAGNSDAIGSLHAPADDFESNAVTTLNVLRAARSAGVKRFVFASSALIYGPAASCPVPEDTLPCPAFPYAASKYACEMLIEAFARAYYLPYVIGRLFVTYGPDEPLSSRAEVSQFFRALRHGSSIETLGDPGAKSRDFVHVFDVIEALITLAAHTVTGIVNIGTGRETSLRQLTGLVASALQCPAPRLTWVRAPGEEYRLVADTTRLRGLGYQTAIRLEDGLAALASSASGLPYAPSSPANEATRQ